MIVDYPYVRAYCKVLQWDEKRIQAEIAKAQQADAPTDVVRLLPNGNWTRLKDYANIPFWVDKLNVK